MVFWEEITNKTLTTYSLYPFVFSNSNLGRNVVFDYFQKMFQDSSMRRVLYSSIEKHLLQYDLIASLLESPV